MKLRGGRRLRGFIKLIIVLIKPMWDVSVYPSVDWQLVGTSDTKARMIVREELNKAAIIYTLKTQKTPIYN